MMASKAVETTQAYCEIALTILSELFICALVSLPKYKYDVDGFENTRIRLLRVHEILDHLLHHP